MCDVEYIFLDRIGGDNLQLACSDVLNKVRFYGSVHRTSKLQVRIFLTLVCLHHQKYVQ